MGPPPFKGLNIYTQLCFAKIYGQAEWPAHTCQGPRINPTDSCDLTPSAYASEIIGCMNNHGNSLDSSDYHRLALSDRYASPSETDLRYWRDAFGVLLDNFDLARWAMCLVEAWSPEVRGLSLESEVESLVTPNTSGTIPVSVTYVKGVAGKEETQADGSVVYKGATAWAFTRSRPADGGDVGVIQAIWNQQWIERRADYERGGQAALCACTQLAAMILHEMVHIVGDYWDHTKQRRTSKETYGDGYVSPYPMMTPDYTGTLHEPDEEPEGGGDWVEWPCWDECHMVESIFVWAMAQRYTCLSQTREDSGPPTGGLGGGSKTDYSSGCHRMGADDLFALSFGTHAQISNKSGEKGYRPDRKI